MPPIIGHVVLGSIHVRFTHESGHVGKLTTFNGGSWLKALGFDESGEGKNLRVRAPTIPSFFKTGLSFLPKRLKAARDCQTSITRQPPGIGPAMCASTPLTGQSASLFLRPFNIILTLFFGPEATWYSCSKQRPIRDC